MRTTIARLTSVGAVLVVAVMLAGCSAIGGIIKEATGSDPFNNTDPFSIKVGDCFAEPDFADDDTVSEISFVECSAAHDNEAYASVLMSDAAFPGDDATVDQAEDACGSRFLSFIGAASDYAGTLNYSAFFPTAESWDAGDREILCYVYDDAGQTIGSLENAAG